MPRKKRENVWLERYKAFFVGVGIVAFWRGMWGLLDMYLFPSSPELSTWASIVLGAVILMTMHRFIRSF